MKEHHDACRERVKEKSAFAELTWKNGHPILWEEATIIDQEEMDGAARKRDTAHQPSSEM